VGMPQRRHQFCLTAKASGESFFACEVRMNDFDRDLAVECRMVCAIYFCHPATTQVSCDDVLAEGLRCHLDHVLPLLEYEKKHVERDHNQDQRAPTSVNIRAKQIAEAVIHGTDKHAPFCVGGVCLDARQAAIA